MKYSLFLLLATCLFCNLQGQPNQLDYQSFEKQILNYRPVQAAGISDKDFRFATMVIEETQKAVDNNPENFNRADYFNVLTAFVTLRESEKHIKLAFEKFRSSEGSCEYFIHFKEAVQEKKSYEIIRQEFLEQSALCEQNQESTAPFDLQVYCSKLNLDPGLVQIIQSIEEDDQKYRKSNSEETRSRQQELDRQNQAIVDSLYNIYGKYIGKSLVGKRFESTMWAVIQHSNAEMMKRYLPLIHAAVQEKEIHVAPFKMLIDRFYGIKYGYQVFGSQTNAAWELADEKTRQYIERRYDLE